VQPPADVYYNGLTFSTDGNYFYFVRSDPGNPELKFLYRAPLLGGTPQKLLSDVDSNISFSPDGKQFAFMRYDNPVAGRYQLILHSVDDGSERVLASGSNSQNLFYPTWSPDGKTIACSQAHPVNFLEGLVLIDIASGKQSTFYASTKQLFEGARWLPDGSGFVGLIRSQSTNYTLSQVGYLSYPGGKISAITHDTNSYGDLSGAANGRLLATILSEGRWNLQIIPGTGTGADAKQLAAAEAFTGFTWTKDGMIIDDQNNSLHAIDPRTGSRSSIATEEGNPGGNPSACPDGKYIVFELGFHGGTGDNNIWRIDSAGGNLKQLTTGTRDYRPECSPDSRWVYFIAEHEEGKLSRVPIDGGTPQEISGSPVSQNFDLSPDGKLAAFATLEHSGEHKEKLALVSTEPGQSPKVIDLEKFRFGLLRFSPDGKAVVYPARENGVDNLWAQPLSGEKGHYLTNFKTERIYDMRWSFDGKQLALVRGHTDSDVVLIRDAQQ
jgi:Tol biopolymer transport system component